MHFNTNLHKNLQNKNSVIKKSYNQRQKEHCCIVRICSKKNNIFVNITDLKGQTILKFSSGLIQKNKSKKQLPSVTKWIFEKVSYFVKNNFNYSKVIIKSHRTKSFSYLRDLKRKRLKIIYFQNRVPLVHNGCRPPKQRRI